MVQDEFCTGSILYCLSAVAECDNKGRAWMQLGHAMLVHAVIKTEEWQEQLSAIEVNGIVDNQET